MSADRELRVAARSLVVNYLNVALEVSEASGLERHDPQIIAALIIAQSIDRHSDVTACALQRFSEDMTLELECLAKSITVAMVESK